MWQTEIIVTLILADGHADARLHAAHIVQLALGVLLECPLDLSHVRTKPRRAARSHLRDHRAELQPAVMRLTPPVEHHHFRAP